MTPRQEENSQGTEFRKYRSDRNLLRPYNFDTGEGTVFIDFFFFFFLSLYSFFHQNLLLNNGKERQHIMSHLHMTLLEKSLEL